MRAIRYYLLVVGGALVLACSTSGSDPVTHDATPDTLTDPAEDSTQPDLLQDLNLPPDAVPDLSPELPGPGDVVEVDDAPTLPDLPPDTADLAEDSAQPDAHQPLACDSNLDCDPADYCLLQDCSGTGECTPRPTGCDDVWDPVCGCDGVTYGNECEAAVMGMSVAFLGECPPAACTTNDECAATEYCFLETGCDGEGTCTEKPLGCPDVDDPVCGCDGVTYGNACDAAAVGVNVKSQGACPQPPCTDTEDCMGGYYCLKPSCETPQGECYPKPTGCPLNLDPVCGCDGKTYTNACVAHASGMNIDYVGPCQDPEDGCQSNDDCAATEYCHFEADCAPPGSCQPRPTICPDVWDPVCGCNGQTYGNACEAYAAGVNIGGDCDTFQ